jgi:UDPglucose--hexose-1-phosphate uridylyltransferase
MDKSELRLDPLTREWTIFNENRAIPPSLARTDGANLAPSPFCAGDERFASHSLYQSNRRDGWQVRVVPNRTPVLAIEADPAMKEAGIFRSIGGFGAHEIVIEDPGTRNFSELDAQEVSLVAEAWRSRIEDLMRDGRMLSFSVVKNEGAAAGQVVNHSISQIVALGLVAPTLRRKLNSAREYFTTHGTSIFADILAGEQKAGARVVFENNGFVVFCPYAARTPFELSIWPKRQCADFHKVTQDEVGQLGEALHKATGMVNRALETPAFHLMLTTAPSIGARDEWPDTGSSFCWHVDILPRLHPVSTLELATGCHINGVWPEEAAAFLRAQK